MALAETLRTLRSRPPHGGSFAAWRHFAARPASFAPYPATLDPRLMSALRSRGIENLYCHQAQASEAATAAENVVVVTPTASGKTLCYNLPVLTAILSDSSSR